MQHFDFKESNTGFSCLVVNGRTIRSSRFFQTESKWSGWVSDRQETEFLISLRCQDFVNHFEEISLEARIDLDEFLFISEISIEFSHHDLMNILRIELSLKNVENWANPYTVSEYLSSFRAAVENSSEKCQFFEHKQENVILGLRAGLHCPIESLEVQLNEILMQWVVKLKSLLASAVSTLLKNARKNSIITFFDFPVSIRVACQQYLLYFAQFLEDLGIKASSEIKEDAGRVLFSVTPVDGPGALGKIKEALEAYLDLPRNPEFNAAADEFSDIAVSQLKANVFFLKSQLATAQAILEAKNTTIEALKLTIYQQRQLLTGSTSDEGVKEDENESEPILGDTVHLTKYEGKFLRVDLPTILRRLKRSFGIDEKKK